MEPEIQHTAVDVLARSPLFKALEPSVLQCMVRRLKLVRWVRHETVLPTRRPVDRFYLLLTGRVKVVCDNLRTGRALTLFVFGPGNPIGVLGGNTGLFGDASVVTLDDVVALSGATTTWHRWVSNCPVLRSATGEYLAEANNQLANLGRDLALHDTMTRLARLIIRYATPVNGGNSVRVDLIEDLPNQELAYMIGSVRVVANRLLMVLRRQGVIDPRPTELKVLDYEKLIQIAKGGDSV